MVCFDITQSSWPLKVNEREEGADDRWGNSVLCLCLLLQLASVPEQKKKFILKINLNMVHHQSQVCHSSLNFVSTQPWNKTTIFISTMLTRDFLFTMQTVNTLKGEQIFTDAVSNAGIGTQTPTQFNKHDSQQWL